ncbi:DUF5753 domain-containing protein [Streptomyces sp. NPDC005151]
MSCNEIQRLFITLVVQPAHDAAHRLSWSDWRRRHQARSKACHYQRHADHPVTGCGHPHGVGHQLREHQLPSVSRRAVTVASQQWQTADEIEKFVQVRLARQERLLSDEPLQLWAVISEAVLLQEVGGAQVMSAQLTHLLASSEHPNVTVQVLPFSRGAHASMFGPYVLLGFPEEGVLDVVLVDNPSGSMWLERAADVSRYQNLFDAARTSALSPNESRAVIHRRSKEHQE